MQHMQKQHTKQFAVDKKLSETAEYKLCTMLKEQYGLQCQKIETHDTEIDYDLIDQYGDRYEVKTYRKATVQPWNQLCIELTSRGRDGLGWIYHCMAAGVKYLITCVTDENDDILYWHIYDFSRLYKNVQDILRFFAPNGLEEKEWDKVKFVCTKSEGKWLLYIKDVYNYDNDWSIQQKYLRKCLVTPAA